MIGFDSTQVELSCSRRVVESQKAVMIEMISRNKRHSFCDELQFRKFVHRLSFRRSEKLCLDAKINVWHCSWIEKLSSREKIEKQKIKSEKSEENEFFLKRKFQWRIFVLEIDYRFAVDSVDELQKG